MSNENRYSKIAIGTFMLVVGFLFGLAAYDVMKNHQAEQELQSFEHKQLEMERQHRTRELLSEGRENDTVRREFMQACMEDALTKHKQAAEALRQMQEEAASRTPRTTADSFMPRTPPVPYTAPPLSYDEQECDRKHKRMLEEERIREKYAL